MAVACRPPKVRALAPKQEGGFRLAQPSSRLHQCVEHCLQIERRTADDLEHVGGGRLLLKRFAQFVEQPRVLDGDDGLGGEARDQRDLLIGKGTNFLAGKGERPISSFSFTIGTARNVRIPPSSTAATVSGSRSI